MVDPQMVMSVMQLLGSLNQGQGGGGQQQAPPMQQQFPPIQQPRPPVGQGNNAVGYGYQPQQIMDLRRRQQQQQGGGIDIMSILKLLGSLNLGGEQAVPVEAEGGYGDIFGNPSGRASQGRPQQLTF